MNPSGRISSQAGMRFLVPAALLALLATDALAQGIVLERVVIDRPAPEQLRPQSIYLSAHGVEITIEDQVARTEVTQIFHNPNPWQMEGVYLFALPEGASVSGFTMQMGDKQVTGELLDAKHAADIYRSIVQRRDDPGLLEYAGRGLLRARLFPIEPRSDTKVTLRFEQVLAPVGGVVEMVYPLRTEAFGGPAVRTWGRIDVKDASGVATLYSPSHPLDVVRKGADHVLASFETTASRADRDLQVLYGRGADRVGATLASHKPAGEDGTFLLLLSPNVALEKGRVLPKDIVFVIDTSGSMGDRGGKKMQQAKAALTYALGRLAEHDRFNVVAFATEARAFRETPVPATKDNVAAALAYVEGLVATGGTAIHDALTRALQLERTTDRVPIVFFLTDGEPTVGVTEPARIRDAAKAANGAKARLFVFGVGDDVNALLLTDLATDNAGSGHFVSESENIELKVSALYDKVASPVLTDVTVRIDGEGDYDVYPRRLGDLFQGQQIAIVGRYTKTGARAIRLQGRIDGRETTFVYEATFTGKPDRAYLQRLWAVRKVGFLLEEIRRNGERGELVSEVKDLGTRHGIVTPYTSFLVVDEREMQRRRRPATGLSAGAGDGGAAPEAAGDWEAGARKLGAEMDSAKEALAGGRAGGKGAVAAARRAEELRDGRSDRYGVKSVSGKTFRFVDGFWTDLDVAGAGEATKVRVVYLSDEWTALLADATLARYLSVGTSLRVLHDGTVYEVVAE
jgi:Ca-activated chloride channel family protein